MLHAVVKLRPAEDLARAFDEEATLNVVAASADVVSGVDGAIAPAEGRGATALKEILDALIPYTERHLARAERLVQESYVLDYVLGEMDGLGGLEGEELESLDRVKVHPGALDGGVDGEWDGFGSGSEGNGSDESGMEVDI